jgi:hypothetical protein
MDPIDPTIAPSPGDPAFIVSFFGRTGRLEKKSKVFGELMVGFEPTTPCGVNLISRNPPDAKNLGNPVDFNSIIATKSPILTPFPTSEKSLLECETAVSQWSGSKPGS